MRYLEPRILKTPYNTTQTTIIETLNSMRQKEEIYKISNKKQITIARLIITKADHTKQITIMQDVEYISMLHVFVNKYTVPLINTRLIMSFKNELGNAQIVKLG